MRLFWLLFILLAVFAGFILIAEGVSAQDQYTLSVNTEGNGTVTKNPDQALYAYNDVVKLTANPDPGWFFSQWSGNLTGNANPDTITIYGNTTVTASFIESLDICRVQAINIGNTSATITWITNLGSNSTVNYGTTPALGLTAADSTNTTYHSVTLTNLLPDTVYYYEVISVSSGNNSALDNYCGSYYCYERPNLLVQ